MYTSAKPYFYGTGRRKKSIARVRLYPGTGAITINGKVYPKVEVSAIAKIVADLRAEGGQN